MHFQKIGKGKIKDHKGNILDCPKCGCGKDAQAQLIDVWLCLDCFYGNYIRSHMEEKDE